MSRSPGGAPASTGALPQPEGPFSMPFYPGQIINRKYEIIELIGVGGLGFVVAALHVELGEKVALKFLRPEALANPEAVGRFAREARASAKLQSEHVVRVFDVGTLPDGAPFIVMEHLEGIDLAALLQERGELPIPLAVEYVLQACEALATAHASGIVHRDIKPDNLFLNRRSRGVDVIKVLDFGISKVTIARSAFEIRHPLAETTMAMGSPIYMSPEQIRASKDIDGRTDIWSLGCVLYELLTNRLAFEAPTITEVTALILERETPLLSATRRDVPAALEHVIQRCLAKSPDQRFQNVAELAVALAAFASPRGRIAIERCCSVLQNAGISHHHLALLGANPPPLPEDASPRSNSSGASSTSTVVAPARVSRSPGVTWPLAFGAVMLTAGAAGVFFARSQMGPPEGVPAPLAQPAAAPPLPTAVDSPTTGAAAPATPLVAAPVKAEATGGAMGANLDSTPSAPAANEPAPMPNAMENVPSPAADSVSGAPTAARQSPGSDVRTASPARAEPAKPRPAAPARRRVNSPAPKPRAAASPRPVAVPREEPDVGF